MISDDGANELLHIGNERSGQKSFRLICPNWEIFFVADPSSHSDHAWDIVVISQDPSTATEGSRVMLEKSDTAKVFPLIAEAMSDFGDFYGENAGGVKVTLKAASITHHPRSSFE